MMIAIVAALAAGQLSLGDLNKVCAASAQSCQLYVSAALDGAHLAASAAHYAGHFCAMSADDIQKIVSLLPEASASDMAEHPDDRSLAAVSFVAALGEAVHPCGSRR